MAYLVICSCSTVHGSMFKSLCHFSTYQLECASHDHIPCSVEPFVVEYLLKVDGSKRWTDKHLSMGRTDTDLVAFPCSLYYSISVPREFTQVVAVT